MPLDELCDLEQVTSEALLSERWNGGNNNTFLNWYGDRPGT